MDVLLLSALLFTLLAVCLASALVRNTDSTDSDSSAGKLKPKVCHGDEVPPSRVLAASPGSERPIPASESRGVPVLSEPFKTSEPVKRPEPQHVKAPEPEPVKVPEPEPVKVPETKAEPVMAPEPEKTPEPEQKPLKALEPNEPGPEVVKKAELEPNNLTVSKPTEELATGLQPAKDHETGAIPEPDPEPVVELLPVPKEVQDPVNDEEPLPELITGSSNPEPELDLILNAGEAAAESISFLPGKKQKKLQALMTKEELEEEQRVQQQQLAAIFLLLRENQQVLGEVTEGEMEEQMKLYSL